MKKNFLYAVLLVIIINFGCRSPKKEEKLLPEPVQSTLGEIDEYQAKRKVIDGDTTSYKLLRLLFYKTDRTIEFLPWALIMSNKFNYKPAYHDVYLTIEHFNLRFGNDSTGEQKNNQVLDSSTYKFSRDYLSKYND